MPRFLMTSEQLQFLTIIVVTLISRHEPADGASAAKEMGDLRQRFERLAEEALKVTTGASDPREVLAKNAPIQEMISLGPPCLPYIMERIDERARKGDFYPLLMWAAAEILRVDPGRAAQLGSAFREWLDSKVHRGYEKAEKRFAELRREWQQRRPGTGKAILWNDVCRLHPDFKVLSTERHLTKLGEVYTKIQGLGIFVLPVLIEELKKGNYDFLPIIGHLTNGRADFGGGLAENMAKTCIAWWEQHSSEWIVDLSKVSSNVTGQAGGKR